jgi:hypothetical protein
MTHCPSSTVLASWPSSTVAVASPSGPGKIRFTSHKRPTLMSWMAYWRWPARQPPLLPAVRGWPPSSRWQAPLRRPGPSQCLLGSGGRRATGAGPSAAVLADVAAGGAGVAAGGHTEKPRTVVKTISYFFTLY